MIESMVGLYGEWVDLTFGEHVICRVFVWCHPRTERAELERLALAKLANEVRRSMNPQEVEVAP